MFTIKVSRTIVTIIALFGFCNLSCIWENKEYAKFRKHAFKHKADLEFCFTGTYATGSARLAPSSGYIPPPKYPVSEGTQYTQHENGLETWFGGGYVPEPPNPCTDPPNVFNLGESPQRVIEDDDISSASSRNKGVPVTLSHTSESLGKRSFEGSVNRSSSKKQSVTRADEHDTMLRLVKAVETHVSVSNSVAPTRSGNVNNTTVAMEILSQMRREQPISNDIILFAADLFADNRAKADMFCSLDPDLRLPYLEKKYQQSTNMGGNRKTDMVDDDYDDEWDDDYDDEWEVNRKRNDDFILITSVTAAAIWYQNRRAA
ncbi:hypothetical protein HS088_TW16G00908 [Tripterygium wilfordii]|uniref:Uncharacterized protein n=1 Tax=Tripterygium wilfordii TaxID=458696 RepID=A0A7J7CK77_TRIWF|nr:hypothetical protein HS088_TW16G00908 [Tripterygium wilfordii]